MSATRRWRYQAADARGAMSRGEVEATTVEEAVDLLRRRALWVVEIEADAGSRADAESRSGSRIGSRIDAIVKQSTGSDVALAVITRAVATLLQAGVPLERALAFAVSGETDQQWRGVFGTLRESVTRGDSISDAAANAAALPRSFAPLLAAAEASGTLADTFERLADDLERRSALRARVRAALVYPTVLAVASLVGTLIILVVVVPRFADLIAGVGGTIPTSTRLLILLSAWLSSAWWLIAIVAATAVVGVRQSLMDPARKLRWHTARLKLPVVGQLEQEQTAASYLSTLAVALESGVPLLRAMSLARGTVGNAAIESRLSRAELVVRDGGSASDALSGSLPALSTRLLQAGEQSGAMASLARRAATASADQVQRYITSAVALIEPIMILGFGAVVGFVALALLQAIYGLNASSF